MKRVLVCGGRKYANYAALAAWMDAHFGPHSDGDNYDMRRDLIIIHGAAPGADYRADRWARWHNVQILPFPAHWDDISHPDAIIVTRPDGSQYDCMAGHRRNQRMIDEGKPTLVVAFPGGTGTEDMVARAKKAGITVERAP